MDREKLRALIRLVEESAIDELEIRRWGRTIRIVKHGGRAVLAGPGAHASAGAAPGMTGGASAGTGAALSPAAADPASRGAAPPTGPPLHRITSPMVGTFYRAPAAEAPPFVEVGDAIRPGQTLCILEAMKLMNELLAEVTGTVRAVLVENGDPVEYGQALFDIEH